MNPQISTFRAMVLNMSTGAGLTSKQHDYILSWVENNVPKVQLGKLAEIAWQYDADELSQELKSRHDQFLRDLDSEEELTYSPPPQVA